MHNEEAVRACQNMQCLKTEHDATMLRCGACKYATYCSKECQKLDWKRHKKDCKSLIINSNIMNQKSGSEDFTGDYDNWKTSVQAALTCILCTALADGDCIFSHFASLDVTYRPEQGPLYLKFTIKKTSLKIAPVTEMDNELHTGLKQFRQRMPGQRIGFLILNIKGEDHNSNFTMVRSCPLGPAPPFKVNIPNIIDQVNSGQELNPFA